MKPLVSVSLPFAAILFGNTAIRLLFQHHVDLLRGNNYNHDDLSKQRLAEAMKNAFMANGIFLRLDATENQNWHSQFHFGNTRAVNEGLNKIVIPLGAYFEGVGSATKPNDGLVPILSNGEYMDNSKLYLNQKDLSPRSEKTLGRIAFVYKNDSGISRFGGSETITVTITIDNVQVYCEEPVEETALKFSSYSYTKNLDNPMIISELQTGFVQGTFDISNDASKVQPIVFIKMN